MRGKETPHTLAITVDNEPGALARIVGMFSARGYNIESLTVADISERHDVSRITVVTTGDDHVIEQIIAQLDRLIPVHKVTDLTASGGHVEREMALVKVAGKGDARLEAMSADFETVFTCCHWTLSFSRAGPLTLPT